VRASILPLLLLGLAATWSAPWLSLLGAWNDRTVLSRPSLLLLLGLGWASAGALRRLHVPERARRASAVALGVGAALAVTLAQHGWPPGLGQTPLVELPRLLLPPGPATWAFLLALLLWRGGLLLGAGALDFDRVESAFRRGLAAFVLFVPVAALTAPERYRALQAAAVPDAVAFFFLALTAFALAGLRVARRARPGEEPAPAPDRGWVGVMLGVVVGLLAVTVGLSLLLSLDLLALVASTILRPVLAVVAIVLLAIALPIAYLAAYLAELLRSLIDLSLIRQGQPFGGMQAILDQLRERRQPVEPSPELVLASQWALLVVAAVVIAVVIAGALRWRRDRQEDEDAEELRESVWRWELLVAALRGWLAALLGRRRPVGAGSALAPDQRSAVEPPGAASVRELYRRVLALGAARGQPRRPAATPAEHLPALQSALDPDEDLSALTDAYVAARYGRVEPDDDQIAAAERAWRRVNTLSDREP
jgi:hypothetical protein